jgi:hypothetical protein
MENITSVSAVFADGSCAGEASLAVELVQSLDEVSAWPGRDLVHSGQSNARHPSPPLSGTVRKKPIGSVADPTA